MENRVRWVGLQMGRAENGRGQTWAQSKQVIQSHSSASLLQHRNLQEGESQASSRGQHPAAPSSGQDTVTQSSIQQHPAGFSKECCVTGCYIQ